MVEVGLDATITEIQSIYTIVYFTTFTRPFITENNWWFKGLNEVKHYHTNRITNILSTID